MLQTLNLSKPPKISVIVPCYRTERWLDRCVASLVNQTLQDIEIILVDDGSPDRVPAICDEWATKDARIKVIHQQNAGQGPARNAGLDIAKGEYVAFVDSDDWIDADAYRAAYEEVEHDNSIDTVIFGIFFENRWNREIQTNAVPERMQWKGATTVRNFFLDCMLRDSSYRSRNISPGSEEIRYLTTSIRRRELIETYRIRFLSIPLGEDMIWGIEYTLQCANIVWLPACYYHYRYNDTSTSRKFYVETYDMLREAYSIMLNMDSNPQYVQCIDKIFIDSTRRYILSLVVSDYPYKIRQLYRILKDSIWHELRNRFKAGLLPFYFRIFLYLIYAGNPHAVYILGRLMNYVRCLLKR